MYGKDERMPETNIINPKPGEYGLNSSSFFNESSFYFPGDDYLFGLKNQSGAEAIPGAKNGTGP